MTDPVDSKFVIGPPRLRPLGRSKFGDLKAATETTLVLPSSKQPPCEIWRHKAVA